MEVRRATWEQFDLEASTWVKPTEATKTAKSHRVPLRNAGVAAWGHGFHSSVKGWARQHDVDELLSEFALAHVEGSATVAAYTRDDLLEKRRPVMQAWADCISG